MLERQLLGETGVDAQARRPPTPKPIVASDEQADDDRAVAEEQVLEAFGAASAGRRRSIGSAVRQRGMSTRLTPPSPTSSSVSWRPRGERDDGLAVGQVLLADRRPAPSLQSSVPAMPPTTNRPGPVRGRTSASLRCRSRSASRCAPRSADRNRWPRRPKASSGPVASGQQAEERSLVRRRQRLPGGAAVVGSVEVARLGRQVQRPVGGGGNLVQVEVVVAEDRPWRPRCRRRRWWRAVRRTRRRPGPFGRRRTRRRAAASRVPGAWCTRVPRRAAVARAQDDLVVADGPSELRVVHEDARQQRAGRHVGLASRSRRRRSTRARGRVRRRRPAGRRAPPRRAAATRGEPRLDGVLGASGLSGRAGHRQAPATSARRRADAPHGGGPPRTRAVEHGSSPCGQQSAPAEPHRAGRRRVSRESTERLPAAARRRVKSASVRFRLKSCGRLSL